MIFRNATLLSFPIELDFTQLEKQLDGHRLKSVGPQELASYGAVSPFGPEHTALTHQIGKGILFCVGEERRILPAAAVKEAVRKKVVEIEGREGKKLRGKEKKAIKEDVILDLLPKAMIKPGRTMGYLDLERGFIAMDSGAVRSTESAASLIRGAMGSFPALPLIAEYDPSTLMTQWLRAELLPEPWMLGNSCELKDPVDTAAVVRASGQELLSDEIGHHLDAGKVATKIALVHGDRMSFVLGNDLIIRKIKLLDLAMSGLENQAIETIEQEIDARFALMHGEFGLLFDVIRTTFKLEKNTG